MTGNGFLSYAEGFDLTNAYSSSGNDVATLHDSTEDDQLDILVNRTSITNGNYTNTLEGFSSVTARSENGGNDTATVEAVDYLYRLVGEWNSQS